MSYARHKVLAWDKATILHDNICKKIMGEVSPYVICSYESICKGDSGGPNVCPDGKGRPVLHGITSFGIGPKDCAKGEFSFFTKVSKYIDWIKKNMN